MKKLKWDVNKCILQHKHYELTYILYHTENWGWYVGLWIEDRKTGETEHKYFTATYYKTPGRAKSFAERHYRKEFTK